MTSPWTLHLGDCLPFLRSLPDKSVDHVITDPPYEAEAHGKAMRAGPNSNKFNSARDGHVVAYQIDFSPITEELRDEIAHHSVRASKGWALAFCQVDAVERWRSSFERAGGKWRRAAIWVKPDGAPQFTGDRPAQGFECIAMAWCGVGRSRWNGGGKRGVYEALVNSFGRLTGGRQHPTMKPVDLMEALVRDFTDPGETILDPFAGSGTTGVAAIRLGRKFIGCELSPKYHAVATKRLSQAREQLGLWTGAA